MNNGFKFKSFTKAERTAREAYNAKLLARQDAEIRNAPTKPLHKNLRRFLLAIGLSQREAADRMGKTERAYRSYEKGLRAVPSGALVSLALATGADLNEIMLGRQTTTEEDMID
ncbi:MAG: helix-turn-helix transcriptional regulator [Rhodobacteraceae bacterium]|nr:helix-turn-helix transcriptional regulator [Paracoccaceae bacterium]